MEVQYHPIPLRSDRGRGSLLRQHLLKPLLMRRRSRWQECSMCHQVLILKTLSHYWNKLHYLMYYQFTHTIEACNQGYTVLFLGSKISM